MNRRDFLRTAGGVAGATTATAAGAGTVAGQEGTATDSGGGGAAPGGNVKPVFPDYVSGANDQGYEDLRGQSEVTVTVDSNYFSPTKIWVDPGTTIIWEFVAGGHNVKPNTQPASDLAGTEGGRNATVSSGTTYEATLESAGMYTYFCGPHETLGMKGAIAVGSGVETEQIGGGGGGGGGGGEPNPEHMGVPFRPHYVGVVTLVMMVVSLLFVFFVVKYGESPHASGGNN